MKKVSGLSQAFGKAIAEIRTQQKYSQEELAEKIDSTNVYISMLENGQRQPSLNAVILIAQACQISPEKLVARTIKLLSSK